MHRYAMWFRGSRRQLIAGIGLSALQTLMLLPIPLLVAHSIDKTIPEGRRGLLAVTASAIVLLTALSAGLSIAARAVTLRITRRVATELRRQLIGTVFSVSLDVHRRIPPAELHERILSHVTRVDLAVSLLLRDLLPGSVLCVGLIVVLFVQSPLLTVVTVAVSATALVVSKVSSGWLRRRFVRHHEAQVALSGGVLEMLRSQELTRTHAADNVAIGARHREIEDLEATGISRALAITIFGVTQQTITAIVGATILLVGGISVIDGSITLGALLSFYAGFAILRGPLDALSSSVPVLLEGTASLDQLYELLDLPPDRPYRTGTMRPAITGMVRFDDVTFGYAADRPVVVDFSLELAPNEVVALVGPNGSGKSSVVNLLLGHYRPDKGSVSVDGVPLDDLDLTHFLRHVGVVPQEPFFFSWSIRDNLTFALDDTSSADIDNALRLAGAASFVAALSRGIDTAMGEEARTLSGGQRQRLAIARALVRRPRLLILDEPTNHLDRDAIIEILDNLATAPSRPSILIVSHHEHAVDIADRVVHLRDGRAEQPPASAPSRAVDDVTVRKL